MCLVDELDPIEQRDIVERTDIWEDGCGYSYTTPSVPDLLVKTIPRQPCIISVIFVVVRGVSPYLTSRYPGMFHLYSSSIKHIDSFGNRGTGMTALHDSLSLP